MKLVCFWISVHHVIIVLFYSMYIYIDIRGGRTCDVRCPGLLRVCRNLEGNRVSVPLRKWSDSLTHRTKGFLFWHAVENATPRVVNARLSIYTPGSSLCVEKRQGEGEREREGSESCGHHHSITTLLIMFHYVPAVFSSLPVSLIWLLFSAVYPTKKIFQIFPKSAEVSATRSSETGVLTATRSFSCFI